MIPSIVKQNGGGATSRNTRESYVTQSPGRARQTHSKFSHTLKNVQDMNGNAANGIISPKRWMYGHEPLVPKNQSTF